MHAQMPQLYVDELKSPYEPLCNYLTPRYLAILFYFIIDYSITMQIGGRGICYQRRMYCTIRIGLHLLVKSYRRIQLTEQFPRQVKSDVC
jgi:hypothetical protein